MTTAATHRPQTVARAEASMRRGPSIDAPGSTGASSARRRSRAPSGSDVRTIRSKPIGGADSMFA